MQGVESEPSCGPGRLGGSGGWDRPGPGAAIRGAPVLQTNTAGSKVRDVRQFGPPPRSASYCARYLGYGYGVSGASITHHWPAPSPSTAGAQTHRATGYGNAPAAARAAITAQRSSIPAEVVMMSASCRFRPSREARLPNRGDLLPAHVAC
jgi:hypothetical protein